MGNNRNLTVDILRVVGILLVILAHVPVPNVVFELRTFDVVMLVFLSGVSFTLTYEKTQESYFSYIAKRFLRLVVPVWTFLIVFIPFAMLIGTKYSMYTVVTSFLLLSGIGYVWIFRVFFINAILAPFLYIWIKSSKFFLFTCSLIVILIVNEIFQIFLANLQIDIIADIVKVYIMFTLGYLVPFMVGGLWLNYTKRNKIYTFFTFSLIVIGIVYFVNPTSIQTYKYPPLTLYISYGMVITIILFELLTKVKITNYKLIQCIIWISKHSMQVYLWHIVVISVLSRFLSNYASLNGVIRYCIIVGISLGCMKIQEFIIVKLKSEMCRSKVV